MSTVRYVGLEDLGLDSFEQRQVESAVQKHLDKIAYHVKNEYELTIHLKAYQQAGERKKYSVNLKIAYPGATVTASKGSWELVTAIHESFRALDTQLRSKYAARDEQPAPRSRQKE